MDEVIYDYGTIYLVFVYFAKMLVFAWRFV